MSRPADAPRSPEGSGEPASPRHAGPGVQDGRGGRARSVALGIMGVVGELLITAGVLLGAFVVWQLWWTDVQAGREQASVIEELGWKPLAAPEPAPEPSPSIFRDDAPVLEEPAELTPFGMLYVPRWDGYAAPTITQGVDKKTVLDTGAVGHYPGTAMPGEVGNFSIAGHRTTYGKPLHRIAELVEGDPLVVWTQDTWYVYRVTQHRIILPHQVEVIAPVPTAPPGESPLPTERMITLTSCHPMYSARERYIVHGVLDYWMPTSAGIPAELEGMV